jgi:DNA-directed RNA polymerase subunit M/transcription elongation factor TFIIS
MTTTRNESVVRKTCQQCDSKKAYFYTTNHPKTGRPSKNLECVQCGAVTIK